MPELQEADISYIQPQLRHLAIPIDSLVPDPANARLHPDRNLDVIRASLAKFGQDQPIVVQRNKDGLLIIRKGNGRHRSAKDLGWQFIAALVIDEDDVNAISRGIADNRSSELAEWDTGVLTNLMSTLGESGVAPNDLGFLEDEWEAMTEAAFNDQLADAGDGSEQSPDKGTELATLDLGVKPPRAHVEPGDVWHIGGRHRLLVVPVSRGVKQWIGYVVAAGDGAVFCPYPNTVMPLAIIPDDETLIMVQPSVYAVAQMIDAVTEARPETEVYCAKRGGKDGRWPVRPE